MLTKNEARELLNFKYQGVRVESGIDLDDVWVFRAYLPIGGGEENMNPFLSVDKSTGAVTDFSVTAYPDPMKLLTLFKMEDEARPEKPATPQAALAQRNERR